MAVTKRGKSWQVRINDEHGPGNRRRQISIGTYRTRKEADSAERDAKSAQERGTELSPRSTTVGVLLDRFIADRRARGRAVRTIERYESLARLWITPAAGDLSLARLKPAHVSELLTYASEAGLSPKTQKHILTLLRSALNWAGKLDIVSRNVAEKIDAPIVPRSQAHALSEVEVRALLAHAKHGRWGNFFTLALATGARRGELLALRWSDISPNGREIIIERAFIESARVEGRIVEKPTKTNRARRVPLAKFAKSALNEQLRQQKLDKQEAGDAYDDSGHIFQAALGGRLAPYLATDAFRYCRNRLGFSATLHDLRHTAASWLLAQNVDVPTVAKILGHTTPATTLGIYAHVMPGTDRRAVAALDACFDQLSESSGL